MRLTYYEDENLFFFRKPRGLPTTFGAQKSFIDLLLENATDFFPASKLKKIFGEKEELGLLNRLDNETGGLLYFAKNKHIREKYQQLQEQGKTQKIYIADVHGKITENSKIEHPIMHHKNLDEKMTVRKSKGRGKTHNVKTFLQPLYYEEKKSTTTLQIIITKGKRHQIRCHLSSIGKPIKGDKLYAKHTDGNQLHLRSIGLKIE